jgi:hypothetical protein
MNSQLFILNTSSSFCTIPPNHAFDDRACNQVEEVEDSVLLLPAFGDLERSPVEEAEGSTHHAFRHLE